MTSLSVSVLVFVAALQPTAAPAQESAAADETRVTEEVTVRARRSLSRLRGQVDAARERAYDVFNEINSNDEFDVTCRRESRNGSRMPLFRCTPRFVGDVTRNAVAGFKHTYLSPAQGTRGTMEYLGAMSAVHYKNQQLSDEILRLAAENEEFQESILEWARLQSELVEARRRRFDD